MKSLSVQPLLTCLRHPQLYPLFAIPTHLTGRERTVLFWLARECSRVSPQGAAVVEIGSYLGASASFLAAGLRDGDRIFCIDTWTNDTMSEGQRDTQAAFLANTARYQQLIVPVRGWSHDAPVLDQVRAQAPRVNLLFIDGDHSYQGALADWQLYAPLLAPGAFIVMHDIGWAEGVQRVVAEEIRPRVSYERRLPNLWWGQFEK